MTFEQWWDTNKSRLDGGPDIAGLLAARTPASMRAFAESCWNAALETTAVEASAMRKAIIDHYGTALPSHLNEFLSQRLLAMRNARVPV